MHEDRIKYGTSWEKDGERIDPMSVYKEPVTEREALKLALEAYLCREMPAGTIIGDPKWWVPKIAAAIKEALAQPAQEPVAWVWKDMRGQDIVSLFEPRFNSVPLYTTPPQREWNAALDEAAARIGEIKGFGQATQDSFAVYIKGLKK